MHRLIVAAHMARHLASRHVSADQARSMTAADWQRVARATRVSPSNRRLQYAAIGMLVAVEAASQMNQVNGGLRVMTAGA